MICELLIELTNYYYKQQFVIEEDVVKHTSLKLRLTVVIMSYKIVQHML